MARRSDGHPTGWLSGRMSIRPNGHSIRRLVRVSFPTFVSCVKRCVAFNRVASERLSV